MTLVNHKKMLDMVVVVEIVATVQCSNNKVRYAKKKSHNPLELIHLKMGGDGILVTFEAAVDAITTDSVEVGMQKVNSSIIQRHP